MEKTKAGISAKTRSLLQNVVIRTLVFRRILLLTDGRDKCMKVAQYTAKILLWLSLLEKTNAVKAKQVASHFSLVRKVIRLGHFLEGFNEGVSINKERSFGSLAEKLAPLNVGIGIINDISDDVICLAKLGIVDKQYITKLTPLSDRLWYSSIFFDLHSLWTDYNGLLKKYEQEGNDEAKLKIFQKLSMARISIAKLLADFTFCTIDVFQLEVPEGWQNISGLIAALLGTYKLYIKNK